MKNGLLTPSFFQTVADEKRVVDEQRRTLDEEIADFQRRKVNSVEFYIRICAVFHLHCLKMTIQLHFKASNGTAKKGHFF